MSSIAASRRSYSCEPSASASVNLPVVDVGPFLQSKSSGVQSVNSNSKVQKLKTAAALAKACREFGFFYVTGHGVSVELQARLEQVSREFFAQDEAQKMQMRMALGGRAWRGYFPVGGELTSGKPDVKEGIYFGHELPATHPLVLAQTPLHGGNLFPKNIPHMKSTVLEYIDAATQLGHQVTAALAASLNLPEDYFARLYTAEPLGLFRIFNYPAPTVVNSSAEQWGVGEHTDYGFLTLLKQDNVGGLQVKSQSRWIEAPPLENTFVCNIGDMLDRMTGGLYRSTPHRVRNAAQVDRLSFPFFFDPAFSASVKRIENLPKTYPTADVDDRVARNERWDKANVHAFTGTYGEYLMSKVARVFPELFKASLND